MFNLLPISPLCQKLITTNTHKEAPYQKLLEIGWRGSVEKAEEFYPVFKNVVTFLSQFHGQRHVVKTNTIRIRNEIDYFATAKTLSQLNNNFTDIKDELLEAIRNREIYRALAFGVILGFNRTFGIRHWNMMQYALWYKNYTLVDIIRNDYRIPLAGITDEFFDKDKGNHAYGQWDHEFLLEIIKRGVDINNLDPVDGSTILHCISTYSLMLEKDLEYIHSLGGRINKLTSTVKLSALHLTVNRTNIAVAKWLIACGADIDIIGHQDETPLMHANLHVTEVLLKAGAAIYPKNSQGKTALDFAIERGEFQKEQMLRERAKQEKAQITKIP